VWGPSAGSGAGASEKEKKGEERDRYTRSRPPRRQLHVDATSPRVTRWR
jgi:hypothetical protein